MKSTKSRAKTTKTSKQTVVLPLTTLHRLKICAAMEQMTQGECIAAAVEEYLKDRKIKAKPQSSATDVTEDTEEDLPPAPEMTEEERKRQEEEDEEEERRFQEDLKACREHREQQELEKVNQSRRQIEQAKVVEVQKAVIAAGLKSVAKKVHPDVGGLPEDMYRLNDAVTQLKSGLTK